MIYFIKAEETPYIKIGYTEDVYRRMVKMQADCPLKLIVLKTVEGDRKYEKLLHKKFAAFHYRGEWFKMTEDQIEDLTVLKDNEEVWGKLEEIISKGVFPSREILSNHFTKLERTYIKDNSKRVKALCKKYLGTCQPGVYLKLMRIHTLLQTNKRHKIAGILKMSPQTYWSLRKRYNVFLESLIEK